jgi:hypothetical protein
VSTCGGGGGGGDCDDDDWVLGVVCAQTVVMADLTKESIDLMSRHVKHAHSMPSGKEAKRGKKAPVGVRIGYTTPRMMGR